MKTFHLDNKVILLTGATRYFGTVREFFSYTSDNNDMWLDVKGIKKVINSIKDA